MKKRLLCAMAATLVATALVVGCGSSTEETTSEVTTEITEEAVAEEIAEEVADDTTTESRTLIVGFDAEYPPYGYMDDNGEYTGFDIEMAKLVCESLGWEFVAKPIDWDSKDMELESGTIDCIWNGFSLTPEREDMYTWSAPYVDNSQVIVVAADSGIESLADLAGVNVIVQAGSSALEALNSDDCADLTATFGSLIEIADYNSAFMNLEAGAADAVAVDIGVAEYQVAAREEGAYVILDEAFYSEPYAIGYRLEDTELRDIVDAEIMKFVQDGTYEALAVEFGIDTAMLALLD
ncbi:MAG: amino acid ABC transporter substrate-binding protein [Eubacteriales bacterium]